MRRTRQGRVAATERRVWYLVLHIGVPCRPVDRGFRRHMRRVRDAVRQAGVMIRCVEICDNPTRPMWKHPHYLFRFLRFRRDDSAATRLAESFLYALALTSAPVIEPDEEALTLRVPDSMVRNRDTVSLDALIKVEAARAPEEISIAFPHVALATVASTTEERFEAAWRIGSLVFRDQQLFEAARFLKASRDDFFVSPGEVNEVVYGDEIVPRTSAVQTRFENALQNAFKAIEAVIGHPPKDDRKFFEKLRDIGLDPNEEVGYGEKRPLHEAIRRANDARDKKSAHGRTGDRTIMVGELLNHQACAECIIWAAVEKKLGKAVFSDEKAIGLDGASATPPSGPTTAKPQVNDLEVPA
jgi:hypothetical protein